MLSNLARRALALSLALSPLVNAQFFTEIPAAEASALATIVEDDPASVPQAKGGSDESPAYTLYQKALPIPDVAVPKQCVLE